MVPVRGLPTKTCWIQSTSWPARGIHFIFNAPMVCLRWYGGIDIGSLRLPSLSGSTLITVWVSSKMRVDQCSQIVVPCGVMIAVSGKSWLSAILGLLCKCTSKLPFAIWFALTYKQLCNDPWTLSICRLRGFRITRSWWKSLSRMESHATRAPPLFASPNLRIGKLYWSQQASELILVGTRTPWSIIEYTLPWWK